MIYAAILAGGKGSRMGSTDVPKQFLELDGKPIIIHTIEKMLMCDRFEKVIIGINPDWKSYCEDLISKHIGDNDKIIVCAGGADRNGTLTNVIDVIDGINGIGDDDIIVTHDAVRPFVTKRIIEDNIDAALKYGACDTVVPATDTIVRSDDGEIISVIPERSRLYQGQTPQSFNIKLLTSSFDALTAAPMTFSAFFRSFKSAEPSPFETILCIGQPILRSMATTSPVESPPCEKNSDA